jgi:hypothetical protein
MPLSAAAGVTLRGALLWKPSSPTGTAAQVGAAAALAVRSLVRDRRLRAKFDAETARARERGAAAAAAAAAAAKRKDE